MTIPPNLISIDFETTGLDPSRHQPLEVAMVQVAAGAVFYSRIGWPEVTVTPQALRVNKFNPYSLDQHPSVDAVDTAAADWLSNYAVGGRKFELLGKNVAFDLAFLRRYMPRTASLVGHRNVDLSGIYALLDDATDVERGSTRTAIEKAFQWDHSALGDAWTARHHYMTALHALRQVRLKPVA